MSRFILIEIDIHLHPNISMHILYTVHYPFLAVLTKSVCLTVKSFLVGDHFLLIILCILNFCFSYCKEKLDASYSGSQRV